MAGRLERAKAKRALRKGHRRFVVTGPGVDHGPDRLGCGRTWIMSQRMLDHLNCRFIISRAPGIGTGSKAPMMTFADMNQLMGFPAVHAFEQRYGLADKHKE